MLYKYLSQELDSFKLIYNKYREPSKLIFARVFVLEGKSLIRMDFLKEQVVAADLVDDLIHRYDAPRDLSDDLEPHGYCPPGTGSSEPWEQQVRISFYYSSFFDIRRLRLQ